jgi:hypothetical protein
MSWGRRSRGGLVALTLASTSCDPLVDVAGAFFPAWILCLLIGIVVTAALRWVLARAGLESHLGPLIVVYPSVAITIALACWVVLFRT